MNVFLVSLVCLGNRKGLKITPGSAGTPTISSPFNGLSRHFWHMTASNIKHVHGFYKNTDDLSDRTFDKYRDVNEKAKQ